MRRALAISFALVASALAQSIEQPTPLFETVFDARPVTPYYDGRNPAWLHDETHDERLDVASIFTDDAGDYKRFVDPGGERLYQLLFSGKKHLGESRIFRGSFAARRLERREWEWIAVRDYESGSPYLLGDSTTGRTRYNGIVLEAEYGSTFADRYFFGTRLDYGVDDGLKEVAPRPTSLHRDLEGTIGVGARLNESLALGLQWRGYDRNEELRYREDQGALYDETILLKFRGYDFPSVIRKKVETRYVYRNGYFAGGEFLLTNDHARVIFDGSYGTERSSIKDDANRPQPEGYWQATVARFETRGLFETSADARAGARASFGWEDAYARHPRYDSKMSESRIDRWSGDVGVEYDALDEATFAVELGVRGEDVDRHDYYSAVYWETTRLTTGATFGAEWRVSETLEVKFAGAYRRHDADGGELETSDDATDFFLDRRVADVLYYLQDADEIDASVELRQRFRDQTELSLRLRRRALRADADERVEWRLAFGILFNAY